MRKLLMAILLTFAISGVASAARIEVTTAVDSSSNLTANGDVSFTHTVNLKKESDRYSLWTHVICRHADGLLSMRGFAPLVHMGNTATSGPVGLNEGNVDCTTFVAVFPELYKPIRGSEVNFHVNP